MFCEKCGHELTDDFGSPPASITNEAIESVKASSSLRENGITHKAEYICDGSLKKAWVEGASGQGIGESVTFTVYRGHGFSGLKINAGYQKSKDMKRFVIILFLCTCMFCAGKVDAKTLKAPKKSRIVKVTDYIPDIQTDIRYATKNNFTGKKIYKSKVAYLRYGTILKLKKVQKQLKKENLSLMIWDAYRPVSAQYKLWKVKTIKCR